MTARLGLRGAVAALAACAAVAAVIGAAASAGGTSARVEGGFAGLIAVGFIVLAVAARPAWLLSIGLVLAMFNSHWSDMNSPIPLDRVALVLGVLAALGREWRSRPGSLRTRPIDWLLILCCVYVMISAVIAGTADSHSAQFTFLDRFGVLPFLLFFVAPIAFREEADRRILLGCLVGMGAYLGLTALFETTGPKSLVVPHYITDPSVGIHFDRARGPFVEAAGNGLALFGCAVACAMALAVWRERRTVRWLVVAVGLLCALGTLFTLTRAVWIGVVLGTLGGMLSTRATRRLLGPLVLVGVAGVVIAFAAIPGLYTHATHRKEKQAPLWDRRNSDAAALRMVNKRPLLGFGWNTFGSRSIDYYRESQTYPLTVIGYVHNVFLANASELGLIGAGLWAIALLIALLRGVFRRRGPPELLPWRVGLFAFAIAYFTEANTTPLGFALPTMLLWTLAGVTWVDIRATGRWAVVPRAAA